MEDRPFCGRCLDTHKRHRKGIGTAQLHYPTHDYRLTLCELCRAEQAARIIEWIPLATRPEEPPC